jgi:ketopantoate hydroxymethyltransferase
MKTNPTEREIAEAIDLLNGSKGVTTVTLTAGATSTVLTDARIGVLSFIGLMPTTANAAGALATTYVAVTNGSATITHANTPTVDRTFTVLIQK